MFELFKGLKVDWLGKRKLFFSISMLLLLVGMVSLVVKGRFEYGTDFKGGTVVVVKFNEDRGYRKGSRLVARSGYSDDSVVGSRKRISDRAGESRGERGCESVGSETVTNALNTAFAGKFRIESSESVSAKVGAELRRQAVTATLYALVGILVYIAFRFEWIYGAAAVFAVFHDALITLGFFSLFNYEINLTVIAALLTLVGYSVNDTIVIFDRVRENLKVRRRDDLETILNDSINQTFSRTILTSVLTFLTVMALFLFGGEIINNFAFAMVVGIIVGSYSSVAVAAPLVLIYTNARKPKVATAKRR